MCSKWKCCLKLVTKRLPSVNYIAAYFNVAVTWCQINSERWKSTGLELTITYSSVCCAGKYGYAIYFCIIHVLNVALGENNE
jgi:hypothetical protein